MTGSPPERRVFSLNEYVWQLWRGRQNGLAYLTGAALLGVLVSFVLPVRYEASVTLSPSPTSADRPLLGGALAALSGQFGVDISGVRTQLRFYPKLVTSHWFLTKLARAPLRGDTTIYSMFVTGRSRDSAEAMDAVVDKLRRSISTDVDERANVLTISVRLGTRDAALAAISRTSDLIMAFNTDVRRLSASENRRFIADRSDSARTTLKAAEDSLAHFLKQNRTYEQSPDLALQYQRLQRRIAVLQEVYVTLARSLEEMRIEEVKEASVLTVVDPPHVQWKKVAPHRRNIVVTFLALGLVLFMLQVMYFPLFSGIIPRSAR